MLPMAIAAFGGKKPQQKSKRKQTRKKSKNLQNPCSPAQFCGTMLPVTLAKNKKEKNRVAWYKIICHEDEAGMFPPFLLEQKNDLSNKRIRTWHW
jgi:hypothetical protein